MGKKLLVLFVILQCLTIKASNELSIQPYFTCNILDQSFCDLIETKSFSNEEREFVQTELDYLKSKGLSHILNQIAVNGTNKIIRATYGFTLGLSLTNPLVRQSNHFAFQDSRKGWIVLLDLFFNYPVQQDPISEVSLKPIIFLHELVHAYDSLQNLSRDPYFLEWAGFSLEGPTHDFIKVPRNQKEATIEQIISLKEQNQHHQAEAHERLFAIEYNMPRIYSMKSPEEALADLTAYLFYDPYSNTYIKQELISFIDTYILRGARNY